jgi:hypothetical protein
MKQALKTLRAAKMIILDLIEDENDPASVAYDLIEEAIKELEPRWETPEQYEKRTGEPWPDDAPVFTRSRSGNDGWSVSTWGRHKQAVSFVERMGFSAHDPYVVCATEAGPPPDTWVPEEAGK